jgi:hypothetical protein
LTAPQRFDRVKRGAARNGRKKIRGSDDPDAARSVRPQVNYREVWSENKCARLAVGRCVTDKFSGIFAKCPVPPRITYLIKKKQEVLALMFNTADEAAIAAIELINPTSISRNVEFAGRIYRRNGKYFFTAATTLNRSDDSDPGFRVAGADNVGTYHTHAGGFIETDEIFSPQDKLKATMGKEISYLGTPKQRILKFTPVNLLAPDAREGQVEVLRSVYVLPEVTIVGDPNAP